jgi:inner membrane protein
MRPSGLDCKTEKDRQLGPMDSITQAALGAAVAEAGFGRSRLGNKAILWGIALGTLPDLDVLAYPWLDQMQQLYWHRGISHSLFFILLASPLFGWLIHRFHRSRVSLLRASLTVAAILLTHVLIDVFTVYGTSVFEPFSQVRVGFNNLFIIDPLYTLPLLAGLLVAWFCQTDSPLRSRANATGLILSTLYVVWSLGAKTWADQQFAKALNEQGIPFTQRMSSPTPFNTFLWRSLAANEEYLWIGYFSIFDRPGKIHFDRLPRNLSLLEGTTDTRAVQTLAWFSNGYHRATMENGQLVMSDWRFGEIRPHFDPLGATDPVAPIFSWALSQDESGKWIITQRRPNLRRAEVLPALWKRAVGGIVRTNPPTPELR